jgi:hypothetical protein
MARSREEIMQMHAHDGGCQCGWDLGVGDVREMPLAVRQRKPMNLGMEGLADLRGRAAEVENQPAFVKTVHREAVRSQPFLQSGHILSIRAELRTDLLRAQPVVELGRALCVHGLDTRLQRGLGGRVAPQHEQQMIERHGLLDGAQIAGLDERGWRRVTAERRQIALIDRGADQRLGGVSGSCSDAGQQQKSEEQES